MSEATALQIDELRKRVSDVYDADHWRSAIDLMNETQLNETYFKLVKAGKIIER